MLGTLKVIICCLNYLKKYIFNIFSNITCLCKSCCIRNSKWHIKYFRKCLC